MQISNNNTSPSFSSIHAQVSKMTSKQRRICDSFHRSIDYLEEYTKYKDSLVDIYLLPGKNSSHIKVRYMDPCSGEFFRNKNNKFIEGQLSYDSTQGAIEKFVAGVIKNLKKITEGNIKKTKVNIHKFITGKTTLAKLHPDKAPGDKSLLSFVKELQHSCCLRKADAEEVAYGSYINKLGNEDSDF